MEFHVVTSFSLHRAVLAYMRKVVVVHDTISVEISLEFKFVWNHILIERLPNDRKVDIKTVFMIF